MELADDTKLKTILGIDSGLPDLLDAQLIREITTQFISSANGRIETHPRLLCIGGGPGAGKSYFYEQLKESEALPLNAVVHDPDLVMQSIPEYITDALDDPLAAFKKWEYPARLLANQILLQALRGNHHIIYLRTFALPDSLHFVEKAKEIGYQVEMHFITCNIEIAFARAQIREKITKRHIPSQTIVQRHRAVQALLPTMIKTADYYYIYENNQPDCKPQLKDSKSSI